eukprot:767124-Amphidinium_carterae.1
MSIGSVASTATSSFRLTTNDVEQHETASWRGAQQANDAVAYALRCKDEHHQHSRETIDRVCEWCSCSSEGLCHQVACLQNLANVTLGHVCHLLAIHFQDVGSDFHLR